MYSQRDEEPVILEFFAGRDEGRVLDIGAYDGKTFSNTLALIERGWGGTLIEASPGPFEAMCRLHADRTDRINLVNVCLGDESGKVIPFYASNDAVATDDPAHFEKWKAAANFTPTFMASTYIGAVLQQLPGPYEFVNIDVEGRMTEKLFKSLPFFDLGTELICVEHNGTNAKEVERWATMGADMGFNLAHTTGENHIFRVPS